MKDEEEIEIIVGTYEDYVLGYRLETSRLQSNSSKRNSDISQNGTSGTNELSSLEQSFAIRAHSGSVRSLSSNPDGSLIFSAGHDEMINLFNLRKRKLIHTFEGATNCSCFVGNSHLLCGSTDGNIYIYECKGSLITRAKTLRGHKDGVVSMNPHPSGKVLLSVSADGTMRTWNLIKGRCAFVTHIKSNVHLVKWSQSGDEFLLAANNEIYFYDNTGSLKYNIKLEKRINAVEFIDNNIFVVAGDSGILNFFNLTKDTSKPFLSIDAHSSRIKALYCFHVNDRQSSSEKDLDNDEQLALGEVNRLTTASSDGIIKLWSIGKPMDNLKSVKELASIELGARLTCMVVAIRKFRQ